MEFLAGTSEAIFNDEGKRAISRVGWVKTDNNDRGIGYGKIYNELNITIRKIKSHHLKWERKWPDYGSLS